MSEQEVLEVKGEHLTQRTAAEQLGMSGRWGHARMKDFNLQKSPPLWAIVASERAAVRREMP